MNIEFQSDSNVTIPIHRLASIFSVDKSIIEYISNRAVISGGALLFSLNEFIDPKTVSDIDIYINNKKTFFDIAKYLIHKLDGQAYMIDNRYTVDSNRNCSILEIRSNNRRPFQLIYFHYNDVTDILENVDMDCNQCGLYKGQIIRSTWCIESHQTKTVRYISKMLNHRIKKTLLKGFTFISYPVIEYDLFNPSGLNQLVDIDEFVLGDIIIPQKIHLWIDTAM